MIPQFQSSGEDQEFYKGNFDNSIFALLGGYNTEGYEGGNDFSIRTFYDASSNIFTVGWYNLKLES